MIPSPTPRRARAALLALALLSAPVLPGALAPALALGGSAAGGPPAEVARRAVMVLGSRGNVCSGTVVGPRSVLTAGHCVAGSKAVAVATEENGGTVLQVARQVRVHPGFSGRENVSVDLALLRLDAPLPSPRFAPAPIDRQGAGRVGADAIVAGYGLKRDGDVKSAGELRAARVEVLGPALPRFLRLGVGGGTLAICKGDSGGPVFARDESGATVLVAVLYAAERTDGEYCGGAGQAVRLAPQRAWIDGVLRKWGEL